jgi:hypothetical protein
VEWDFEFSSDKIKDGDEVLAGAVASGAAFGSGEDAVESFHEGIG